MDLSVIIVNYNTKDLLGKLLFSIRKSKLGNYQKETIVVDNASKDHSVIEVQKIYPDVNLIINQQNLGFAKANNQGIKRAKGKYILFLNSDTILPDNTLKIMLDFMEENPRFAASTCKVELTNGKVDPACHRGFPTPWAAFTYFIGLEKLFPKIKILSHYHQFWKDLNSLHEVEAISGAFFMIRRSALNKVGIFDERFFIYAEDIDLCYRLKLMGELIAYNPHTKIIHYKTSSGRKINKSTKITQNDRKIRERTSKYFFETMRLFYDKHYRDRYPLFLRWLILKGIKIVSMIKK